MLSTGAAVTDAPGTASASAGAVAVSKRQLPAEVLFIAGGVSGCLGAAVAVTLFAHVAPAGVALLRVVGAALVLLVWRRPSLRRPRRQWLLIIAFGAALACMNLTFYEAISRIPVGTGVAIEFAGPVFVAALGSRLRRDWAALAIVSAGVLLIAGVNLDEGGIGVVFAAVTAVLWALYIVLGHRVAAAGASVDALALAMLAGAVVISPVSISSVAPVLDSAYLLPAVLGVAVLSSVVPYAIDQLTLSRLPRERYALLLAVMPATAVVVGVVILGQIPDAGDLIGIVLVTVGIMLTRERPDPAAAGGT